jgi:signal transduction histidine kinase
VRRLTIRRKLAVALAVPLVALIVLTGIEIVGASVAVDDVSEQTDLARSVIGPAGIVTALQNERTWLAVYLIGQEATVAVPVEGTEETRAQTDEAIAAFEEDLTGGNETVSQAFGETVQALSELDQVRAEVDANAGPRDLSNLEFGDTIFARYTELIGPLFDATTRVALAVDDPDLRQGATLADALARQIEALSLLLNSTITFATSEGGIDAPEEITRIAGYVSDFREYANTLREPSGAYAELAEERFPQALTDRVNAQVDGALVSGRVDLPTVLAAVDVPEDESFIGYQKAVHEAITDRADDLKSSAEARQLWFGAFAVLALVAAVTLTVLVSRSITRPLRTLTGQAKLMADRRLPDAVLDILETPLGDDVQVPSVEPVSVRTRDEVADVAAALNTVQDSALDLAVEQAVLRRNIADSFVNLGRRNQSLLGRQLDFVTELESHETNPETLASLFRLDHLATRMRRNAESLLVLAGIEPPRKWAAPVRITDVIRAALGEVEDYQRVAIRSVEPATVLGSAAADLAHLIAELLENALTFSPPDQNVEVRGEHRADGEYALAVIDVGFGMPADDIDQANRRLSGAESFTIAPSKYLGHYVAGNLAARHGIRINLGHSPGHGVTAAIDLPPTLLTTEAPTGDPITDPHGNRVLALAPAPPELEPAGSEGNGASGPATLAPWAAPGGDADAAAPAGSGAGGTGTAGAWGAAPAAGAGAPGGGAGAWGAPAGGTQPGAAAAGSWGAPAAGGDAAAWGGSPGPEAGGAGAAGAWGAPAAGSAGGAAAGAWGTPAAGGAPDGSAAGTAGSWGGGAGSGTAGTGDTVARAGGAADRGDGLPAPWNVGEPPKPPRWLTETPPPAPRESGTQRTQSGLVKRSPRGAETDRPEFNVPSGDLLDALSSHANRLKGQGGGPGARSAAASAGEWAPPSGPPSAGASPYPGDPTRPVGSAAPPPFGPPSVAGGRPPLPSRPGGSRSGGGRRGSSTTPTAPTAPTSRPRPAAPDASDRDPVRAFLASGAATTPGATFAGRAGKVPATTPGETTSSGLARRVRGAQLPTTKPRSLRRDGGEQQPQQQQGTRQPPPSRSGEAAAEDVYGFLSSFTKGVQRGLDESRQEEQ